MKLDKLTEDILIEITAYLYEGYALTGSSSYRVLIPELAKGRNIKDVDFIIYPNQNSNNLVSNHITDSFFITRLFETIRGFQFSLVHKKTGCWVDLFPRLREPRFTEIETIHDQKVKLQILEELVYGLCVSTLEKKYNNKTVLSDSIEKLERLAPYINLELFSQIVIENIDQTNYMTDTFSKIINTVKIIQYVIKNCLPYSPPGYKFNNYPSGQARTPNGLQIESPDLYNKAMKLHYKYLDSYQKSKVV